jgi:hypothetical protein
VRHNLFSEAERHSAGEEVPVFYRTRTFPNVCTVPHTVPVAPLSLSLSHTHTHTHIRARMQTLIHIDNTYNKTVGGGEALNL